MDSRFEKVGRALGTPAYVAVGFGVIAFQRAQVRRRELERHFGRLANTVGDKLGDVSADVATRLPSEARDALKAAGDLVQDLPREAGEAAKEVVALGRFVLDATRRPGGGRPLP
jgi:hypothetical protein